jgi:hypothetical protein
MRTVLVSVLFWLIPFIVFPSTGHADTECPSEKELLNFLETENTPAVSLLPSTKKIEDGFIPGKNAKAGTVRNISGTVLVLHEHSDTAYTLKQGLAVFNGDTIITAKMSRVTLLLLDKSLLTLTPQSKLVLERSLYNRGTGSRDTRLQLLFGRLRTIVSKITGENIYRIKTPTAAAGARGTDFGLAVAPAPNDSSSLLTALVTGAGGSTVELSDLEGGSVLVGPLSVASVKAACPVCPAVRVGQAARRTLQRIAPELEAAATADATSRVWTNEFADDADLFGLDRAVENALARGIEPASILAFVVNNKEKYLLWSTLKALFCANITKDQIKSAGERLGISWDDLSEAFEESMLECGSKIALQDRDVLEIPDTEGTVVSPSAP